MANAVRGEHKFTLEGVGDFTLRLSMGALAEIEDALGAKTLGELMQRMANMSSMDLARVMHALAKAGGHKDLTLEEIEDWPPHVAAYTQAITATLRAGGFIKGGDEAPAKKGKGQ